MSEPMSTAQEVLGILNPAHLHIAERFVALAETLSLKEEIRPAAKTTKCVYSKKKPKRALFTVECGQDKLRIKANLFSLDAYREAVEGSSESIKKAITSARKCTACSAGCKGGARFTLAGEAYYTCTAQSFFFEGLCEEDWERLSELVQLECNA